MNRHDYPLHFDQAEVSEHLPLEVPSEREIQRIRDGIDLHKRRVMQADQLKALESATRGLGR